MDTPRLPAFDGSQLCAQIGDVDLFIPHKGGGSSIPKAVCHNGCPFLDPCLEYALHTDVLGIWGGTSHKERQQIREQRNITPTTVTGTPIMLRDKEWDDDKAHQALQAYRQGDRSAYAVEGTRYLSRTQQRARRSAGDAA